MLNPSEIFDAYVRNPIESAASHATYQNVWLVLGVLALIQLFYIRRHVRAIRIHQTGWTPLAWRLLSSYAPPQLRMQKMQTAALNNQRMHGMPRNWRRQPTQRLQEGTINVSHYS